MIGQSTPDHLLGKVMAYTSAITMCAQPVGQMAYGVFGEVGKRDILLILNRVNYGKVGYSVEYSWGDNAI